DSLCNRSRSSAYKLGAPIALPSEVYNQSIFGCVKRTPPNGVPESYREATPTPLGDWVKFKRETTNVTKNLGVSSLVGSDGSRWVQSLVLIPEGLLCAGATQTGSPTPRCVPSDRVDRSTGSSLFGDSACTQRLGGRCDPNPKLIEDFDPTQTTAPSGSCT